MKQILIRSAIIALLFMTVSCSNEGTEINDSDKNSFSRLLKSGNRGLVLSFTNAQEFEDGILRTFSIINDEDVITLTNDTSITDILNFYSITNGEVYLSEKHFINARTGRIVRSLILDLSTGDYDEINIDVPLSNEPVNDYFGTCPQGTAFLGYCTGTSGSQAFNQCVGDLAADFAFNLVQNGNPCGTVVQSNALFGAAVCWQGCS